MESLSTINNFLKLKIYFNKVRTLKVHQTGTHEGNEMTYKHVRLMYNKVTNTIDDLVVLKRYNYREETENEETNKNQVIDK